MNEQSQAPIGEQDRQALQTQLQHDRESFKAEVASHNEADAARLGHIATGHEVHADMSGNMLNPEDRQELREKGPVAVK